MSWFQILSIAILATLLLLTVTAATFGKITRRESFIWSGLWISACAAILKPDLTMTLARKLGIGRGADLLLYCAVGVMMVGFMMVYIRLRRIRREITLIVRHLALKEVKNGLIADEQKS